MKKPNRDIDQAASDIASFLKMFVFNRVHYKYETFEDYRNRKLQSGYKSVELMKLCHIDRSIILHLASYAPGKYYKLTDIWPMLEPQIKHHGKVSKKYKSGKTFNLLSWYSLSDDALKELYKNNPTLDKLTPRAQRAWKRFINKQQNNMNNTNETHEDKPIDELIAKNEKSVSKAAKRAAKRSAPKAKIEKPKAAKIQAPENDIPEEEYVLAATPTSKKATSVLPLPQTTTQAIMTRLRELVKQKAMGVHTARIYAKMIGQNENDIKEPITGACINDFDEHLQERLDFLRAFVKYVKADDIQLSNENEKWLNRTYHLLIEKSKMYNIPVN